MPTFAKRITASFRQGAAARAFRNRPYRIYATGNFVSLIGTWMQRLGVGWLIWDMTGSGTWLGAVAAAELLPSLIFGLVGGAVAERVDRIRITWICQIILVTQAVVLGGLTIAGLVAPWNLFALQLVQGFVTSFGQPARLSLIPSLVRTEDIPAAVAINSVLWNSARFLGPAIAGVLIAWVGVGWTFVANGVSFIAFLIALTRLDLPRTPTKRQTSGMLSQIGEGVRYASRHPGIAPLLVLLIFVSIWLRPFAELLPGFADAVFGLGPTGLAMLTAATGVGAIIAGAWMSQRGRIRGNTALAVGSVLVFTVAVLTFTATSWVAVALPALAVAGGAMTVHGVATQSLIQASCESGMLGRVLSLYGLSFRAGPAIGALVMGGTGDIVGLRIPLATGAVICLAAWAWTIRKQKRIAVLLERGRGPRITERPARS